MLCHSISTCRQRYCGRCSAEYLIGDRWLKCPRSTTGFTGEKLVVKGVNKIEHFHITK